MAAELINRGDGRYLEQWSMRSKTGRVDKYGTPVIYKQSLTRANDIRGRPTNNPGEWSCSCGAWTFQRNYPHPSPKRPNPPMRALHDGVLCEKADLDALGIYPNGFCKHIMDILSLRERYVTQIETRQVVHVQTEEYDITLEENGRLSALVGQL